jgi:excisionase family DNA binding protein
MKRTMIATAKQLRRNGRMKRAAAAAAAKEALQPESPLATVREAARYLKLSKPSIYKLIDTGALPSVKILKNRRIPWAALKALAEVS